VILAEELHMWLEWLSHTLRASTRPLPAERGRQDELEITAGSNTRPTAGSEPQWIEIADLRAPQRLGKREPANTHG
jgi:hypothetical protein